MMNQNNRLHTNEIKAGYDDKIILNDISIAIPNNKINVIIGANACGKSTLLKTMARLIKPESGTISLDGKAISKMPAKEFAGCWAFFLNRQSFLKASPSLT